MAKKPPPGGLNVVPETATIAIGVTQFVFCSEPRAAWSSSDPAVASVDNRGAVLGVAAGAASIRANYRNKKGAMTITVEASEIPPVDLPDYGPRTDITQPAGAIVVLPGADTIQAAINNFPAGSTFWITAGVYPVTAPITPKTGTTLIGEYGAILDGTGWTSSDSTQAAIRAHNQDINNVTIRNLVIRHMPQFAVRASAPFPNPLAYSTAGADGWIVESCEIADNLLGLTLGNTSIIRHNRIVRNVGPTQASGQEALWGAGIQATLTTDTLIEHNEIAANGSNQRFTYARRCTVRDNWFHDNVYVGIWFDGENTEILIEGNTFEDQTFGVIGEVNGAGSLIRSNTFNRHSDSAIFLSTSHGWEIDSNTITAAFRGINITVDVARVGEPGGGLDAHYHQDIYAHDNVIHVPATAGAWASVCSGINGDASAYAGGAFNLTWTQNTYFAATTTGLYFYWFGLQKPFAQWQAQAVPQDATGSITAE